MRLDNRNASFTYKNTVSVLNQTLNSTISLSHILRSEQALLSPTASSPQLHKQQKQQEHDRQLRLNNLQVIGTHNSYHREVSLPERVIFPSLMASVDPRVEDYYYSHASVHDQLERQQVRSFEFDLYVDTHGGLFANPLIRQLANMSDADKQHYGLPKPAMEQPGTKVLHIADADVGTICHTLVECLTQVRTWSEAKHGQHVPIPILLEFKKTEPGIEKQGGVRAEDWTVEALDRVDAEIRSVFSDGQLITPDDIRKQAQHNNNNDKANTAITLEDAILSFEHGGGWPTLASSRGKFFFVMDNEPTHPINIRDPYRSGGRSNLEGRVIFTNSVPGQPDAAFIKRNDPITANNQREIQDLVAKGYFIRTRADEPIQMILHDNGDAPAMRKAALASGAHIVSTDWAGAAVSARYNSDYFVALPGPARCNPVNAPLICDDEYLEIN
jgi:Phosphoinositide phospholipase C, Ca2+-dependent